MGTISRFLGFESIPEQTREEAPVQPPQGSGVLPPARDTTVLTTDAALHIANVYRAISILATGASQLTLDTWRGGERLEKPSLIRKPNIDTNLSAFLQSVVVSLAVSGNAYWKLTRNDRNVVTNIELLNPWECTPGEPGTLAWSGRTTPLKRSEFEHLALLRVPGTRVGLGPIQAARVELTGALDLQGFAGNWFTSGDVPTGILKTDQVLSPEQAEGWKTKWQGRAAHETAVLGNGLDYRPILLSPKDAQFLEVQQFTTTGIARLFGIPAHLFLAAVEGGSMTYANISQADLTFVRWTLMQYLREIEEAFSNVLPGQQTARFNLDALLRPDTKTRYEAHKIGIDGGFLSIEQVKEIEGL